MVHYTIIITFFIFYISLIKNIWCILLWFVIRGTSPHTLLVYGTEKVGNHFIRPYFGFLAYSKYHECNATWSNYSFLYYTAVLQTSGAEFINYSMVQTTTIGDYTAHTAKTYPLIREIETMLDKTDRRDKPMLTCLGGCSTMRNGVNFQDFCQILPFIFPTYLTPTVAS